MNETQYLENTIKLAQYYKKLGNSTLSQLNEDDIHWSPGDASNSVATIVKHLWGNMLSRWTNFLTEDGEKPWRLRDEEFEDDIQNIDELMSKWEEGWKCFLSALESLTADDLNKTIYIRNEGHSVADAIQRQMAHYPMHVGQMIYIGKLLKGDKWQCLSIPKGQSENYNTQKFKDDRADRHFTDNV